MNIRNISMGMFIGASLLLSSALVGAGQNKPTKDENAFIAAAVKGDLKEVSRLLEKGININARSENGRTALAEAAYNGRREAALLLIDKGADWNAKDAAGEAPIHHAVRRGDVDLAGILIARGANPNEENNMGRTPLHMAAGGRRGTVEMLIAKGADVHARSSSGRTPLHDAWSGEIAEVLIAKGADASAKDKYGATPLFQAVRWSRAEVVELLIAKGADVNAKNKFGKTPLWTASMFSLKGMVGLLKAHGAVESEAGPLPVAPVAPVTLGGNKAPKDEAYAYLAVSKSGGARLKRANLSKWGGAQPYGSKELAGVWGNIIESPFSNLGRPGGYDIYPLLAVPQILGVEYYKILSSGEGSRTIAQSQGIMEYPLTVEDGHLYLLEAGPVDGSTGKALVFDLLRESLAANLAAGLKDADPHTRIKAAMGAAAVLKAGASALLMAPLLTPGLFEMLSEPYAIGYARQAFEMLGEFAAPFLLEKIRAGDPKPKAAAVLALSKMSAADKDALPVLLKVLEDKSLRETAAAALGKTAGALRREVTFGYALDEKALRDPSMDVLGEAGLAAFSACLRDPSDDWTRELAAQVLGYLGPRAQRAVPILVEVQKGDRSRSVRKAAETALLEIPK